MKHYRYKVAEHLLEVVLSDDSLDIARLLPSFSPFVSDDEGKPVMTMTVGRSAAPDFSQLQEIGQFDCGGANHGVYATADGCYRFEISLPEANGGTLSCCMEADADFSHCRATLTGSSDHECQFGLNNAIMMAFAFATAEMNTLLVHASVIRNGGYGYLFTAPSGTGKSTHTHLWYKHIAGSDLMNDDNPVVRMKDGRCIVYGSPWSGKTPCYRNISAPVGAITRIEQAPVNEIERMQPIAAFAMMLPAVSSMKWDRRVYNVICDCIAALLPTTRIFLLRCRPDEEAARICHAAVAVQPENDRQ